MFSFSQGHMEEAGDVKGCSLCRNIGQEQCNGC